MKTNELLKCEIAIIGMPLIPMENQPEFSERNYFQKLNAVMLLMGYYTNRCSNTYLFNYFIDSEINIGQEFLVVVNAVNDSKFIPQLFNICNYLGTNFFYHIKKETREISMIKKSQIDGGIDTIAIPLIKAKKAEIDYQNIPTFFNSFRELQMFSKQMVTQLGRPILNELKIIPFHK